ncbi:MAG: HAMP domain-containing histidine kinase, partial [Clostridia bacterium]|nr:HAMP domain-containing histidine kinase [Clostridia bacterium]
LSSLTIFEENDMARTEFNLSDLVEQAIDRNAERFNERRIELKTDIDKGITLYGQPEALGEIMNELIENALKYARGDAAFRLCREGERVKLIAENKTELPDGAVDQVFDRFTVLKNAEEGSVGLGLAYVKEITAAHNGRASAAVEDGRFILRLDL